MVTQSALAVFAGAGRLCTAALHRWEEDMRRFSQHNQTLAQKCQTLRQLQGQSRYRQASSYELDTASTVASNDKQNAIHPSRSSFQQAHSL